MIFFTHLPKTGGSTFRHILINNFTWRHLDFYRLPKRIVRPVDFPLLDSPLLLRKIKSLSGHNLRYSDDIKLKFPNFQFVVFLRDPISRIISLYLHIQRVENPELQFREWVNANYNTPLLSNFQTAFVAGEPNLTTAKSILGNNYFFTGSVDLFDNSLLMLKKMIGDKFDVRYVRKNVATRNKDEILKDSDNRDALQKLYQHNELDMLLNDYVKKSIFSKYEQEYGTITENDIVEFKKLNKRFRTNLIKLSMFRIVKYFFYENLFLIKSIRS